MSFFSRKRKPRPCEVCGMRGYHDEDVHRVRAHQLAADIKFLHSELDDPDPEYQIPGAGRRHESELVKISMLFDDAVKPLGLTDDQIERLIATA